MQRSTQIRLPAVRTGFSCLKSRTEKPSGLAYILLSILSSESGRTWREAMEPMGIPEEMFPIFRQEFEEMMGSGMVWYGRPPRFDDPVDDVVLKDLGRDAFSKGVIARGTEPMHGFLYYLPAMGEGSKYAADGEQPAAMTAQAVSAFGAEDLKPDEIRLEETLFKKKAKYGVKPEEDIFELEFGESEVLMYNQSVGLEFDGARGCFSIVNAPKTDSRFVKSSFAPSDLVPSVWGDVRNKPNGRDLTVKSWGSEAPDDWGACTYTLPVDFAWDKGTVLADPAVCDCKGAVALGCGGMVVLLSGTEGREYRFTTRPTPVDGMDGAVDMHCVVGRAIGRERISAIADELLAASRPGTAREAGVLASVIHTIDPSRAVDVLSEYLSRCPDMGAEIKAMSDLFRKEKWWGSVPAAAEEAMCQRPGSFARDAKALAALNMKVSGVPLAQQMARGEVSLEDADALCGVSKDSAPVVSALGVGDRMVDSVLKGAAGEGRSKPFQTMYNAGRLLSHLKAAFSVRSLSDYSIDLAAMDGGQLNGLKRDSATFSKDVSDMEKYLRGAEGFDELRQYGAMFRDLSSAAAGSSKLEDLRGRALGIGLGVELEAALGALGLEGDLKEKIVGARDAGLISGETFAVLEDVRRFRNGCAHEIQCPKVDDSTRKAWIQAVRSVQPTMGAGE